ncbi:MAG: methyl-accepting chemotaxis protein [Proteobacteria bacterium]|nr:methyl-accepting chemotaxis protein [Pseudomonadota bacterium]
MNMSFKNKLLGAMLILGLLPLTVGTLISYLESKDVIMTQANERAAIVGGDKAHLIEGYFDKELTGLSDLATSSLATNALKDFSVAMNSYRGIELTKAEKDKLEDFYKTTFSKMYAEKNSGDAFDSSPVLSSLDAVTYSAQYDYIANNSNKLGEKNNLTLAERKTPYNDAHAKYHPEFDAFLKRHGLYDIFLVNDEGRVVYTVFKEVDFATDLSKGPLAGSGLGQAFLRSKSLKNAETHLEDFAAYGPSYEAPASFISSPIFINGEFKGAMIMQLPLDRITAIANKRETLGEMGQTLLVGSDGKLRADAHRQKDKYSVAESFKKNSKFSLAFPALDAAKSGKTGVMSGTSYDGLETLSYFQPIKIGNVTWSLVTELSTKEILSGFDAMEMHLIILSIVSVVAILVVAWLLGNSFTAKLQTVIKAISASSREVSAASKESENTASELSAAATEQAASLQETMASLEEISAMVSQNADSAGKARSEVDRNFNSTEEGSKNVGDMIHAIQEIKSTNEEILEQMETSNKEFGAIVQIISEIGNKTKVINDIVFQTKLLSFNASVEAARAGEHGKGFAVVAEEVGNLAQMSGNAAKEITDMLSASIKKVNSIVDDTKQKVDRLIEVGRDKVTYGQSVADKCKMALDEISVSSKNLTTMISEIAQASKEQAQGVQEINTAIAQLDQVTQQNSTVAQQSSSQAQNLLGQTQDLGQALTSLVSFVEGSNQNTTPSKSYHSSGNTDSTHVAKSSTRPSSKSEKSVQRAHSSTRNEQKAPAKLLDYKRNASHSKMSSDSIDNGSSKSNASDVKIAAGSDVVPSSSNASFEDF